MLPEVSAGLRVELLGDEGKVLRVYDDATGKPIGPGTLVKGNPSIGVGRNLSGRGITDDESEYLLKNDEAQLERDLATLLPWLASQSTGRQIAVYSLYFNTELGNPQRFLAKWPNFLAQMDRGQYDQAADNLETSKPWCDQVGPRAKRLGDLVRYG